MKPTKPVYKSNKNLVTKPSTNRRLGVNTDFGETMIPIGSDDLFVQLPVLSNTYTYNIINTAEMTGNITLKTTSGGSMKGLMLNTSGGSVSIDPIRSTTDQITLESDVKDGSFIQTLSNGSEWFVWSVATGGTLSIRTGGINSTFTPTIVLPTPADITNVAITSDVRFVGSGLEARHDLTFSGEGEPGATLTITEAGDAIAPIVITIPSTGNWTVTRTTDLPNATYTFDFSPTAGNGVQNKSFIADTGPITFTVPSAFSPDPAEVVDFAAGASAAKPDGTPITVTVDSTAWNSGLAHGATFNIIYSITDAAVNGGVTVSQTVAGEIVDDTPPAAPVISAASITNINELSANGTAEPNKTITLFQDSLALSPTVTSDGGGNWSFGPVALSFNNNFTLKAQASEPGVGNPNRSAFVEYSPAFNHVQPQVTKPTLTIDGETKSTWSNTAGTFTLRGTTEAGSTISIKNGSGAATLAGGPSVVGTDWTATMTVGDESISNLTAVATLAGHHPNTSDPFGLLIDRVGPAITLTGGAQTVGLPNVGSNLDSGFSAYDSSSGVATSTSNWDTQVSTTTEGTYTVTYNATDVAGNSATPVTRDVTVTTEVIIPVITGVTANINGTFTITGTVTGTYADNLTVQVTIDDSNSGSPVSVTSGTFTHTTSAKSPETYEFKAKSINTATDESSLSSVQSATIAVPDTTAPVIVITNDADDSVITNTTVNITEGDTFTFTATATDNIDGTITGDIVTGGDTLDTTTAGTYNLTFNVDDDAGNAATQATLTVEVSAAASFIEDIPTVVTRNSGISGGIADVNGSGRAQGMTVLLSTDGVIEYSGGQPVNDEFTISWWMLPDASQAANALGVMGEEWGFQQKYGLQIGNVGSSFSQPGYIIKVKQLNVNFNSTSTNGDIGDGNYHHFAIRCEAVGTNLVNKLFVDGVLLTETGGWANIQGNVPPGTKLLPPESSQTFKFGSSNTTGKSIKAQFDSMQIGDGIVLTDSQIAAIAAQSDRQMSIATAAAIDVTPPIITVTNTDTSADITGTPHVVNLTEGDTFNFSATTDDGSSVAQGGDTLLLNTAGTYNLTFDSTDAAGNVADQKSLQVVVAEADAFSAQELKRLGVASTGTWANYSLGATYWRDSSMGSPDPSAPTTNAVSYAISNSARDAEIGTFKESLDIASMSVGQTYHVQWRRGRNLAIQYGTAGDVYLSLIDFAGLENLYTSTFGGTLGSTGAAAWTGGGTDGVNAVKHARHQSEIVYKLAGLNGSEHATTAGYRGASYIERTDGTNQTQRQDIDSTTFTTYTLNTQSGYHPVSHWYDLHRFTIEKTVSGFDIGLDIHDGSSWSTYVGTGGSLQATPWSVTSLPNTLNVVAFNDQGSQNKAGGPLLPFIDVTITLS